MGTNSCQPCEPVAVDDQRPDVGHSLTFDRRALGIASDRLNRVEKPGDPDLVAVSAAVAAATSRLPPACAHSSPSCASPKPSQHPPLPPLSTPQRRRSPPRQHRRRPRSAVVPEHLRRRHRRVPPHLHRLSVDAGLRRQRAEQLPHPPPTRALSSAAHPPTGRRSTTRNRAPRGHTPPDTGTPNTAQPPVPTAPADPSPSPTTATTRHRRSEHPRIVAPRRRSLHLHRVGATDRTRVTPDTRR